MAPPRRSSDDDLDDLDLGDDEPKRGRAGRQARSRGIRRARSAPVRGWDSGGPGKDSDEPDDLDFLGDVDEDRPRRPVFWRARDSLFFEPLVALAVVAVLLVSLYAYTDNWPPVYAVESNSMQHGSGDHLGVLNAGDIVLAQKIPIANIVPYVVGVGSGYQTYGEPGDVLLFSPFGEASSTPIIHRALFYLSWNPARSEYNATDLSSLPCSDSSPLPSYYTPGTPATPGEPVNCAVTNLSLSDSIHLYHVGQMSLDFDISLQSVGLGTHSGFVTLGDNNSAIDQSPAVNGTGAVRSSLVEPGWIIGVARGMVPWFGAIKLAFEGESGLVPSQSWEFLGLTIAAVIFLAFGIHYLLRREGIESRLRKREAEEARVAEPEEEEPSHGHRFADALRPWRADEDESPPPARHKARPRPLTYDERRRAHFVSARERPPSRPRHRSRKDSDEDDDDL